MTVTAKKFLGHDDGIVVLEKLFSPRFMKTQQDLFPMVDHDGGSAPVSAFQERSN